MDYWNCQRKIARIQKNISRQILSLPAYAFLSVAFRYFPVMRFIFYLFISRDFPVISAGCSIPMISIIVGIMSARHPPSLSV